MKNLINLTKKLKRKFSTKQFITYFNNSEIFFDVTTIEKLEGIYLKDNRRSTVKLISIQGKKIVVKKPSDKDRRYWIRFLTLFRKSEAMSSLESMKILRKHNILTNRPLACIEYRKFGMVISSKMIYEYIEGSLASNMHSREIIAVLKHIHSLGYLHGDPQQKNFIFTNGKIATIDANLKRNYFGSIGKYVEYLKLSRKFQDGYKYINTQSLSYKIANFYLQNYHFLKLFKKLRNIIKSYIK
jgi:heptose II phosphotransferase